MSEEENGTYLLLGEVGKIFTERDDGLDSVGLCERERDGDREQEREGRVKVGELKVQTFSPRPSFFFPTL